ncbi:hypothetical protein SVIO_045750 [Streptomyces violaceusniger]|uniref:Beta-ketoacyl synthase N-terminal domain-containing protein n=1 Tax=Streptomyces violaceusniger TaxID=68280 RepID=A0A4D4KYQ2_STRVO|nr:hypothetical protein SVIO_045750 [Streptomyces violaceusniger]
MVNAPSGAAPVISAWTAVSPLGLRGADFTAALRSGRPAARPLDPEEWSAPFREASLVPDFHIRQILGRKGTRSMDRATGLAVTAIRHLLTGEREHGEGERLPGWARRPVSRSAPAPAPPRASWTSPGTRWWARSPSTWTRPGSPTP